MNQSSKVKLAKALAQYAHHGQLYGSLDYFSYHVMGVADSFSKNSPEHLVAILHDVVEDSGVTLDTIFNLFGYNVEVSVALLTKRGGQNYQEYIGNLMADMTATRVKIADLKFNMSQPNSRNYQKYAHALSVLEGHELAEECGL